VYDYFITDLAAQGFHETQLTYINLHGRLVSVRLSE